MELGKPGLRPDPARRASDLQEQQQHRTREEQGYYDRLQRAYSWVGRSRGTADGEEKFIFSWIALNALYGRAENNRPRKNPSGNTAENEESKAEADLEWFLGEICRVDDDHVLLGELESLKEPILQIAGDQYLCGAYWYGDPRTKVEAIISFDKRAVSDALKKRNSLECLRVLFVSRLRVLLYSPPESKQGWS